MIAGAQNFIDSISFCEWSVNLDDDFYIFSKPDFSKVKGVSFSCNFILVIHCMSGHLMGAVNNVPFGIVSGDVRFFFPGQLIEFTDCSDSTDASVLLLSLPFLRTLDVDMYLTSIDSDKTHMVNASSRGAFERYLFICRDIIEGVHNKEKKEAVRLLTKAYVIAMSHFVTQERGGKNDSVPQPRSLVKAFFLYLRRDYEKYHRVEHYADLLCVTPKHLSFAVKRSTGHGAYFWIDRMIFIDAKQKLMNTDYPIARVSEMLGFTNQTVFGRFFRQHAGCSPREFRTHRQLPLEPLPDPLHIWGGE